MYVHLAPSPRLTPLCGRDTTLAEETERIPYVYVHNYGKIRQLNLVLGVAFATDLPPVIRGVLAANRRVLADPAPVVGVGRLGESAIAIAVRPWVAVANYVDAIGELNQALVEACRAERNELALPQQEVRLLNNRPASPAGGADPPANRDRTLHTLSAFWSSASNPEHGL